MTTDTFQRKLTAILSADVVGYSRLMGEDEDSTIRTLTAYRTLMTSLIQKHRGHVVDTPGDNLLAEFGSIMDAVRCAVEIQEELRIRNADLPDNRRMQFRIGINLGDIVEDGDHIYGDGVNIAARVEGLAEGGGICISGTVYDAIRNKLSMSYEFMGEHVVKNIKELVRIYRIKVEPEAETVKLKEKKLRLMKWQWVALSVAAILILGSMAYIMFDKLYLGRHATETKQGPVLSDVAHVPNTIAVLPFDDLSPEKDQEYFVLGLSEEILNSLAQISDLTVIAKTSSFSFKGANKKVQEIGNELGVENILEGSVRKAGNALRITAQLVKAVDGSHLWSKTYDRELKDIFAVQEDIATAVANELKATLGIGKSFRQLGGTDNKEAYELYLVAKGQLHRSGSFDDMNHALESIEPAIKLDPDFALAWDLKAKAHIQLSQYGPVNQATTEQDAALQAAQRAIELESNLGSGYVKMGFVLWNRNDWIKAETYFCKALDLLNESLSGDEDYIVAYYNSVGKFKRARELIDQIQRYDPLNTGYRGHYMMNLAILGNTQGAEEEYKRCKATFGDNAWHDRVITWISLGSGEIVSRDKIVSADSIDIIAKEYLGSPKEGLVELRRLYTDDGSINSRFLIEIAIWAAYFGDPEFAMDAIERLGTIGFNEWLPAFHKVRRLPRFKQYIKKIGLVDYWNKFGWPDICHKLDNGDFVCD